MVATSTGHERSGEVAVGSSVLGGLVSSILGLLHLFLLGVGGWLGIGLLFVVWPVLGGVVAAVGIGGLTRERPLAAALSGTYGAAIVSVVVLVSGGLGFWSAFITRTFGVSLWSVFFTFALASIITWTVSGYVAGYAADRLL
ncbi:MAG: hypothetical protein ACLFM8_07830 [Halobacteriales archaeon]